MGQWALSRFLFLHVSLASKLERHLQEETAHYNQDFFIFNLSNSAIATKEFCADTQPRLVETVELSAAAAE